MPEFANTILCIEDDRETAALIAEDLSERGYHVGLAHDGSTGFSAILRLDPNLVLCDLVMPTSGFEVLKRLSGAAPQIRNVPFIFLSAMTDREVESAARSLGADDFVTKPVDFDRLADIIAARLAGATRGALPGYGRTGVPALAARQDLGRRDHPRIVRTDHRFPLRPCAPPPAV